MRPQAFLRFRYLIYGLTGLCVLCFQVWWLYDGFTLRRKALLDRISTGVSQFESQLVLQQLVPTLSVVGADTNSIDLSAMIGKSRLSPSDSEKLLAAEQQLQNGASSISLKISAQHRALRVDPDSQVYYLLRNTISTLSDSSDLVVYHRVGNAQSSFPRGLPLLDENSTEWIESETRQLGSVRVHVVNLTPKVLASMSAAVLFSVFYLLLFVWTILALVRTIRENRRLLQSKANFTQNMTHELKIPISSLFLATEALDHFNEVEDRSKTRAHLLTMRTGLRQLAAVVDRILNSARLEQGQVRLMRAVVPLRPLLEAIVSEMAPLIEARGATIDLDGIPERAAVYADAEQLRHVFYNLIDNAIKYGDGPAHIRISQTSEGDFHLILVEDHGPGIAMEHHERIFEAYYRVPQADRHDVKGYGLGLSLVRQILTLHDGSIRVLRSGTAGTCFEIRLPRHDA